MRATRSAAVVAVGLLIVTAAAGTPAQADEVRDAQWHLAALRVDEAHEETLGAGVTVAVLDSGVDGSHPDLRDNVLPGFDLTLRGSDGREDPVGSGTALAGLIAGHGHGLAASPGDPDPGPGGTGDPDRDPADDPDRDPADDPDQDPADDPGQDPADDPDSDPDQSAGDPAGDPAGDLVPPDGVLGLAPRAAILPVVVADPGVAPEPATLAAGIDTAVANGAQVICLGRPVPDHPAVSRAIGAAVGQGVLVIAPAQVGGDALARYGEVGLLGAVALGDDRAVTPPAGTAGVVAVPAIGVTSTGGQGGYFRFARTADAAASAVLAGAVALVRAAYPELPVAEVARRITGTADRGALDLVGALTAEVPSPPAVPSPGPSAPATSPPVDQAPGRIGAEDGATEWVAAFDSGDWRRWLVATPLVGFLLVLSTASLVSARRARR